jgi:hypothetical protein
VGVVRFSAVPWRRGSGLAGGARQAKTHQTRHSADKTVQAMKMQETQVQDKIARLLSHERDSLPLG